MAIEETIGYRFNDASLLEQALTHRSADADTNNQRLEFLGDRVLGIIIAQKLFERFPDEREGELARRFAGLVSGVALADVAQTINLGQKLKLSSSEEASDGRNNSSSLEDSCEALIGAIYLDGGLDAARTFVLRFWEDIMSRDSEPPKDAKTTLQEWAQAHGLPLPDYNELERSGPAHAPQFTVEVRVRERRAVGEGASKRSAEQDAARLLLEEIGGE